jgi:hypothetical protein
VELPRTLLILPLVLALSPAASAAQGTGTGGAVAEPPRQGEGGGALAPERYAAPSPSGSGTTGGAPAAEAASVTSPRTRWEEPRDTQWAPSPNVEEPRGGEVSLHAVDEQPAAAEAARVEGEPSAARDVEGDELLPWTGLEVAALAAIGLGLVTLGVALRPRRRGHARAPR